MINPKYEGEARKILFEKRYQVMRKLGQGGYGIVFLVNKFSNSTGIYAVKCFFLKNNNKDANFKKYIQQEVKTMCTVEHPNVVRFENSFIESGWYFILMEYCDMGNLLNYQSKLPNKIFNLYEATKIMTEILDGIETVHKKSIIHRDIKLENIFLKKNKMGGFNCKIGDFGFAKQIQQITKTSCGTTLFMAPQIFRKVPYGFEADVWSLGVVFYFMLFGEYPFKSINIQKEIATKCSNGFSLLDASINLKQQKQFQLIEDLFRRIFNLDQTKRMKLSQLKNHKIFRLEQRRNTESSQTQDQIQQQLGFCLQKVNFIQQLLLDFTNLNILEPFIYHASRFYLFKVILYILNEQQILFYRKQQPKNKLNSSIVSKQQQIWNYLFEQYQNLSKFTNQTKKINKFEQGFSLKVQDFYEMKEGYRNTISIVYSQVQKKISNQSLKLQFKLRVLCCHLINRVFKRGFSKEVFPNFNIWYLKKTKIQPRKYHQFSKFKEWYQSENNLKLISQIQKINKTFYC